MKSAAFWAGVVVGVLAGSITAGWLGYFDCSVSVGEPTIRKKTTTVSV